MSRSAIAFVTVGTLLGSLGVAMSPAPAEAQRTSSSAGPSPSPSPKPRAPYSGTLVPVPSKTRAPYSGTLVSGHAEAARTSSLTDEPVKVFTPQDNTYVGSDDVGRLEASYTYRASYETSTFSWRFSADPSYCTAATLVGPFTADVYNNGGLVPRTHYSKPGVNPCYGFHAAYTNDKINDRGNYQLRGNFKIRTPTGVKLGAFTFDFRITH